tara:strand:- start:70 stop:897 length:828 start_codon:yes stop_codon:yes gene_type:complete
MKIKHNKKRNTAFVFESLIKEITVAILKENTDRKNKAVSILRKHFNPDTLLYRHLQCYRSLYENQGLTPQISQNILREAKLATRLLDVEGLFVQQTELINDINKELDPKVFSNFVPNYKSLATIDQIFSDKLSPKQSVILETQIVEKMTNREPAITGPDSVDNLVITSFINKFNEKYDRDLLENQKELLNHYISSFADNALGLKMFLNEEIGRLKSRITEALKVEEIENDSEMTAKTSKVFEKLQSFTTATVNEDVVLAVLRTQQLEQEIFENGD